MTSVMTIPDSLDAILAMCQPWGHVTSSRVTIFANSFAKKRATAPCLVSLCSAHQDTSNDIHLDLAVTLRSRDLLTLTLYEVITPLALLGPREPDAIRRLKSDVTHDVKGVLVGHQRFSLITYSQIEVIQSRKGAMVMAISSQTDSMQLAPAAQAMTWDSLSWTLHFGVNLKLRPDLEISWESSPP